MAAAGIELDDYLAAVAALTTTGQPAAQAHHQLKAAIAGMTRESKDTAIVFKQLGVHNFKELIKYLRGETLNKKCPNGYHFVSYMSMNVGIVYSINGVLKNYYPKGLRFSANINSSF